MQRPRFRLKRATVPACTGAQLLRHLPIGNSTTVTRPWLEAFSTDDDGRAVDETKSRTVRKTGARHSPEPAARTKRTTPTFFMTPSMPPAAREALANRGLGISACSSAFAKAAAADLLGLAAPFVVQRNDQPTKTVVPRIDPCQLRSNVRLTRIQGRESPDEQAARRSVLADGVMSPARFSGTTGNVANW